MSDENSPLIGNWNYPTSVRFGVGRIKELAKACRALDIKRPLLVTDPGIKLLPMIGDAIAANEQDGLPTGLFAEVRPNPIGANVESGIRVYRDGGHDGVIAWGGGSAMDTAKAIALMVGQTRPMWDFEDVGSNWKNVNPDGIAPIVAVPTTSGTGSEVGRASVITHEATHTKKIIFHPKMMPGIVICDPELVAGLPANITAWTGMDALAHCLEAYCAPFYHPMAEGVAVEGMRLVKEWLPEAVANGKNLTARAHMMSAAAMGATAFQKGLGAIHSLSHPVGSIFDTHHGRTNAVFMPYVLAFNRKTINDKMARLAKWLGLKGRGTTAIIDWSLQLREQFKISHTAAELGVDGNRLDELSKMAAEDPTAGGNPRKAGVRQMRAMYEAAMVGKI